MHLSIVLVAPARAENVGAAARAMKTMGFRDLRIVDSDAHLQPAARWVAHGSGDILDNITTYPTLARRCMTLTLPLPPPPAAGRVPLLRHAAATAAAAGGESQWMNHAALVFGRKIPD
jgi:tRNA/rRNA methyltransferase